jgi:hypothetical protein
MPPRSARTAPPPGTGLLPLASLAPTHVVSLLPQAPHSPPYPCHASPRDSCTAIMAPFPPFFATL